MSEDKDTLSEVKFNGPHPGHFQIACSPQTDYGRCYRIGIWGRVEDSYYAIENATLKKIGEVQGDGSMGTVIPDALTIEEAQAQELMDSLWEAGIRPDKAKLKKLQVGALEHHLSDMKKIVFDYLMPTLLNKQRQANIDLEALVRNPDNLKNQEEK